MRLRARSCGAGARPRPAHTSPIYVVVAGKPAGLAEDAKYFLAWIDRHQAIVEDRDRIPGEKWQAMVRAEINAARKVYQQIIERDR